MVKRYGDILDYFGRVAAKLPKREKGPYVLYTDYTALEQRCKELGAKEQVLYDIHEALGIRWGDDPYHAIKLLKESEQRCRELEAENKSTTDWLYKVGIVSGENPYQLVDMMITLQSENAELRKRLEKEGEE